MAEQLHELGQEENLAQVQEKMFVEFHCPVWERSHDLGQLLEMKLGPDQEWVLEHWLWIGDWREMSQFLLQCQMMLFYQSFSDSFCLAFFVEGVVRQRCCVAEEAMGQ